MEEPGDHLGLHAVVDGLAEGARGLEPVHLGGVHAAVTHHAHLGDKVLELIPQILKKWLYCPDNIIPYCPDLPSCFILS